MTVGAPEANVDCLRLIELLETPLRGVSQLEVQNMCFLACVLSLFHGTPASEWGYSFARTEFGTPFGRQVDEALGALGNAGCISSEGGRYSLTGRGLLVLQSLRELRLLKTRDRYLVAASRCVLLVPQGTVMRGIEQEPTVRSSALKEHASALLQGPALNLLYDHFEGISTVLGSNREDLLSASIVWLTYMADEPVSRLEPADRQTADV